MDAQLSFDDILQAQPNVAAPVATAPKRRQPRVRATATAPLAPRQMPKDPTEFHASDGWWYPIHNTFYCGNQLFVSVDMRVDGACRLPDCKRPFGEHYHTIGTDRPELFR